MPQEQTTREQHIEWLRRSSTRRRPLFEDRMDRAWQIARRSAQLLRDRYDVKRIRVFGSLLHPDIFHENSDVDLAVEGLAVHNYWDALADVLFFDDEIIVDLVDPDACLPAVWENVEREGVDI